ncbi:hypothetical protein LJB96_02755 [Methanobrevibacter sp. OttesenSCG-928-K11]|nr:hypothetical protein [Methanobrevibacter sp. OttesenSCG-928-K11]MDL2270529.1 hypothetical protein [Methanobrevibacter sp. OttesenSCG-928-I08]
MKTVYIEDLNIIDTVESSEVLSEIKEKTIEKIPPLLKVNVMYKCENYFS